MKVFNLYGAKAFLFTWNWRKLQIRIKMFWFLKIKLEYRALLRHQLNFYL